MPLPPVAIAGRPRHGATVCMRVRSSGFLGLRETGSIGLPDRRHDASPIE